MPRAANAAAYSPNPRNSSHFVTRLSPANSRSPSPQPAAPTAGFFPVFFLLPASSFFFAALFGAAFSSFAFASCPGSAPSSETGAPCAGSVLEETDGVFSVETRRRFFVAVSICSPSAPGFASRDVRVSLFFKASPSIVASAFPGGSITSRASSGSSSSRLASSATAAYAAAAAACGVLASGGLNSNASAPAPARSISGASEGFKPASALARAPEPAGRPGFPGVFAPKLFSDLRTPCTRSARPSPPPPAWIFSARWSALFAALIRRPAVVVGFALSASSRTIATFFGSPMAATAASAASRFSAASANAAAITSSGDMSTAEGVDAGRPGVLPAPGVFAFGVLAFGVLPGAEDRPGGSSFRALKSARASSPRPSPRRARRFSASASTPKSPATTFASMAPAA
mmetsp:Transcript_10423/g.44356  ORF Transcript_10423/g.44356 Transcript_10423/m.44356 type:complete len:402 (-) Transcript_10423:351-1556(-)